MLFDAVDGHLTHFGEAVDPLLADTWRKAGGKQMVIYQTEILPQLVARRVWRSRLENRRVLCFVDNNAARDALLKGYTTDVVASDLISEFWLAESRLGCASWFCRVASAANIADGPSRGDHSELDRLGSVRVLPQ